MADAVPVTDVLGEAMEYLSKLGSNLRVRSENFKQKRIGKDKLKNAHAVKKAASKVLLICELSKKSIENVETGVKKVLTRLSASQTSDVGGKTRKHKPEERAKSEYFIYKSRKLRIKNKVNLKHYMSVDVKATALTKDLQEKYPVYYDCNLYRMRTRKHKNKLQDKDKEEDPDSINDNSIDDVDHNMYATVSQVEDNEKEIIICNDISSLSKSLMSDNCRDDVCDESERQSVPIIEEDTTKPKELLENDCNSNSQNNETEGKTKDLDIENNDNILSDTLLDDKCSQKTEIDSEHKKRVTKNKSKIKKRKLKHIKIIEDSSESDKEIVTKSKIKKKKLKRIKVIDDSSESNKEVDKDVSDKSINATEKNNLSSKEHAVQNSSITECIAANNNELCEVETSKELSDVDQNNELTVTTSTKECNEDKNIQKEDENQSVNELNTDYVNPNKKRKLSCDKSDSDDDSNIENPRKEDKDIIEENQERQKVCKNEDKRDDSGDGSSQKTTESRPFIKCVNINKLLKADKKVDKKLKTNESLIEISDSDNEDKHKEYRSWKNKIQNGNNKERHSNRENLDTDKKNKTNEDEEYWIHKRKEVKKFIPKKFHISITRMPKLSVKYLINHHLKIVTENGVVVCESHSKPSTNKNSATHDGKETEAKQNDAAISDMNVVKNTLLNDSDSDNITMDNFHNNPESIIGTSDNINNKSKSNMTLSGKDKDKSDTNDTNCTDKQRTPEPATVKSKSDVETDIVKSSLMKDSSDETLVESDSKKRKKSDSTTPSKRKHIMESMHAKKMLLTYSSSSDTEDEQLRSALKEIRNSLLQESIDESKQSDVGRAIENDKNKDISESEGIEIKTQKEKKTKELKKSEKSETEENKQSDSSAKDSNRRRRRSIEENLNSSSKKMSEAKSNGNGSSNINSDIEDQIAKDIDGLTNLKTLSKRHRRRSSSDKPKTYRTRSKMPKAPQISEEGFLQAESSSDEASLCDNDVVEELPTVPLTGLNGDDIGHLAKDDLLGDSDSSSTQNDKDTQEDTQNNESSDENVTSKRRKANAISSDSEVGSSRKKNKNVRTSDFSDSEDDNSEPVKKSKRKKKGSDSDASGSSSIDGSKKKRRRIKNIDDSDDGSDSETENEGKNKHGRKNIRKVMGKNQLEEATKKAARKEKERIARIAERQKLYNNLEFDESGKPDEVVLDKVILDFDPETKEPLIEVDKGLVKKLKPHQANGIKFMWDACFESVKRIKKDKGSGCILAHCMGLGKTLQVVTLTHTLLTHGSLTGVRRVLVVCPLSTVLNWVNEFRMWLKYTHGDFEVDVYELSRYKQNSERAYQLQQWFQGGGVCVLGYEMFRNLSADNVKKFKKKMLRNFQESLVDPGPDLVVCDEGHLLKNEKTSLSQAMNRICTLRRIVLTGTPLQNNLKEYYCMVQFVKPNLLGKYNEYLNRFVNPITNGQYTDSTEHDIRIMKRRSHVLHKMLDGAVQRRDYGVLAPFLPPKHEYVLFITLTDVQIKLYQEYLDNYSRRPLPGKSSGFLFPDFQSLQRIWTHPLVLKYNSERYEIMQQKKRDREEEDSEGSLVDFIDDESSPEDTSSEDLTDDSSGMSDDSRKKSKKKKSGKKSKGKEGKAGARRGTRANPIDAEEDERLTDVAEVKHDNPTEWWIKLVGEDELEDLRHSHKLVLLFDILRQCETIGDKLLVFSQSLYSLDLIEHFLGKVDEATQEARVDEKLNGHVGSWSPGVDYFRLDGSTSCENRSIWCKNFNREDNPRARLFLISTRAGGLGINLVAANRVVIFDVSWNPSHDVQSIFRVYRFGQKKPCYVYRFLAMGTMEEKIYERQVTKQAISKRVIDEQQIDRHYAENDLAELYKFEPRPPVPRELPPLPKDRLFAEMLREHEAQIYKYHEHDSLLENKEEETLTEEERKAAWEDFENEKTRPPPAPFPATYGMHNGMMSGLLAQQQQLAYAAVAAMLRKDMPNINDNQIRDMLPMIYQANPGLMQKMSEVYKYAQPNMMNPGMMNPVMSSGSGAMGMGGSSGLQYEPPWQRQQQQQQQMRLQQLLQQQQNMGAKFYAGGLGSRDPVAMALQQQRAREMMLGERQRPRGRPPARTTAQPSNDVVNLDSD